MDSENQRVLAITDSKHDSALLEVFNNLNILTIDSFKPEDEEKGVDYGIFDFIYDKIKKEYKDNTITAIVIPFLLGSNYTNMLSLKLGLQIRLNKSVFPNLWNVPLIYLTDDSFQTIINQDQKGYSSLLFTREVYFAKNKEELKTIIDERLNGNSSLTQDNVKEEFLDKLIIPKPELFVSHHSITNLWGVYRFDKYSFPNDELYRKQGVFPMIYDNPDQHKELSNRFFSSFFSIYFRYQLAKTNYNSNNDPETKFLFWDKIPKSRKVLLIDDEATIGWKEVLKRVFGKESLDYVAKDENKQDEFSDFIRKAEEKIEEKQWDLILLDLRISYQDQKGFTNDDNKKRKVIKVKNKEQEEEYDGVKLLRQIRGIKDEGGKEIENPLNNKPKNFITPVIIFTASNKFTNIQPILDLGADGYFIKESPELSNNPNFTINNLENFRDNVLTLFEKGKKLNEFKKCIDTIKEQNLINKQNLEKPKTKYEKRIIERLDMFLGLLRKSYSESKFDAENFYYSTEELAFITLWSVLNEIQEAYYEKTQPPIHPVKLNNTNGEFLLDDNGNPKTTHDDRRNTELTYLNTPNTKHYKWEIKNQPNDVLMEYEYTIPTDENGEPIKINNGYFKFDWKVKTTIKFTGENYEVDTNSYNYSEKLHVQIAFLIMRKNELSGNSNESQYLSSLKKLNELRNKLYLTHGDSTDNNFYKYTEEEKKENGDTKIEINKEIKDLFELIGFLLTGKNITVNL